MKRIGIVLIITLCALTSIAQTDGQKAARYFVNEIIDKTQAVIIRDTVIDDTRFITSELPEYCDYELARIHIKNLRTKYSDVFLIENWTLKSGQRYVLILGIIDVELMIVYNVEGHTLQYCYDWTIKK